MKDAHTPAGAHVVGAPDDGVTRGRVDYNVFMNQTLKDAVSTQVPLGVYLRSSGYEPEPLGLQNTFRLRRNFSEIDFFTPSRREDTPTWA